MKKPKTKNPVIEFIKEKYYSAPHLWYSFLNIAVAAVVWSFICLGIFIWQTEDMKEKDLAGCERAHERLQAIENQCNEQIRNIYKDQALLSDFWLFWNHTMPGYMEGRIGENDITDTIKSFPEYMNAFITENKDIFYKIYFVTAVDLYALSPQPEGGGAYSYNIRYNQYMEEIQSDRTGYPVSINIQDINDMKRNRGMMVFLVNYDYLFDGLKTPYNDYVMLGHGNIVKFWGDEAKKKESPGLWAFLSNYECRRHGNRIEIGFQGMDVIRKNLGSFLAVSCVVLIVTGMMLNWIWQMAKSNARFLNAFILSIQYAKKGNFQKIEVGDRKDNYAMLARELNDMIDNLDLMIKKEYLLKISQQKTEMKAMLYQINPHFLYNTLEIIRAQANMQGDVKVSDALFDLGSMYRMLSKLSDTISFRQEIEILTHYLNILEIGNQENFYYNIDVEEELLDLETVKFWMQPLAENYFVHGYDRTKEYNLFSVQGQKENGIYRILIMDNGTGMGEEEIRRRNLELEGLEGLPRENIGIRNVYQRLKYFYRNKMSFRISKNKPKGLCFEICIEQDWKRS